MLRRVRRRVQNRFFLWTEGQRNSRDRIAGQETGGRVVVLKGLNAYEGTGKRSENKD